MFCRECGSQLREGALFCTNCGKKLTEQGEIKIEKTKEKTVPEQPVMKKEVAQRKIVCSDPASPVGRAAHNGRVSFIKAVKLYFKNYVNFRGRASRSEFWCACLFNFLVGVVAGFIPVLGNLVILALFIPSLSLAIRRLHDTGRSWCYYLMILVPFAGPIILLVQCCKKSDGDNRWGLGPEAADAAVSGDVSHA